MASTHKLLEFRDSLPAEERSHLEARILQSHEALLAEAQEAAEVAALPLLSPDPIRKREWIKKKSHGKADARSLTGAEIAGRALKAQEKKELAANKALNTPCPAGPSVPRTAQTASLASRTPSPDVLGLPASTAPARLQEEPTMGKRKRKVIQAYNEARQAGLPSLGYSQ